MSSSSSSSHATITYTSISGDMPSWAIPLMDAYESEPEAPKAAPQSPDQAPLFLVPALNYIGDSEPIEDDFEEDPEEDPIDYPSKEEEEEEPLAPTDFTSPTLGSAPSSEETKPFEEGETVAASPSPVSPHIVVTLSQIDLRRAWKTVRPQPPLPPSIEAHIIEYADALCCVSKALNL
uniref:Reverse transcriptase domain-containing protein n=1 Tax=Tanacetum cinerariifolium TaxID=118510 RepID=A0A6L2N7S9_TANCI|nr:hypothetical protein [Tanacetum cinerariifolium]